MLQAIAGSSSGAAQAYAGAKPAHAALQAQLQRYQQQLSDCVNCASAGTAQGKADIAAIAARITLLRQRIAQVDGAASTALAPGASAPPAGRIDVFA